MSSRAAGGWSSIWRFGSLFSFILSVALLFGASGAWAATRYEWQGTASDLYYTTSGNWSTMDTKSDNRFFRSKAAADKRTVKFKENTQIAYELSVESAGTSDSAPYIFLADNDDCGLTSSAKIQVGTYKVGHLAIRRGTFEFKTLDVGNGGNIVAEVAPSGFFISIR